jgi:copper chaperone CopZ
MISNYTVSGMTCDHCAAHITEEVSSLPGVDEVLVDRASGNMKVTSNGPVSFGDIAAAVAEAGDYSVAAK